MRITIEKSKPAGTVIAPPSKSMAHRMLICGGLSEGRSIVHGIAPSQDVLATLDCLKSLGAVLTYDGDTVTIDGIGVPNGTTETLFCRESGSTLRFFLPICMLCSGETTLCGSQTLLNRPMDVYRDICKKQNLKFDQNDKQIVVSGKLSGGDYVIPGNISSQFITGLLFALPLLETDSTVQIIPPVESVPYINMTVDALGQFGVKITWKDANTLYVKGNQRYTPQEAWVEGDYSNAAFFGALDALGADVQVNGLKQDSLQGDKVYQELFVQLSAGRPTIDISHCPDLGPILFAVAAAKNGGVFTGTKRLKIKESDRGRAMAEELEKFGVSVVAEKDTITVDSLDFHKPETPLCGHNDHRVVMSLSVLLTLVGGTMEGAEAVNKSLPDFFEIMEQLGVKIHYETL